MQVKKQKAKTSLRPTTKYLDQPDVVEAPEIVEARKYLTVLGAREEEFSSESS